MLYYQDDSNGVKAGCSSETKVQGISAERIIYGCSEFHMDSLEFPLCSPLASVLLLGFFYELYLQTSMVRQALIFQNLTVNVVHLAPLFILNVKLHFISFELVSKHL